MNNKLNISYVPLSELNASPYNPRIWNKDAISQLTESIKWYGFVDPLLVNSAPKRHNIVIGGHFRLSIAKRLGIAEVPVVYVNIPNLDREKELNIRLNKNVGDWDWDLLAKFDPALLTNIGFSGEELEDIFDIGEVTEEFDVEKELKKIKKPVSKLGDLYQLGNHRLICGDSTDPEVIRRLMSGKKADTILQDPPYNISLDYDKGIGGKGNYGGTVDDAKSDSEYKKFLKSALQNALSVLKKDAHVFTYCDQKYIWLLQSLYAELGISNKRVCLWIKNNSTPTPQVAFNKQYEPCVYGTTGKPYLSEKVLNLTEILNREIGTGNSTIEDIYDLLDIWMVKRLNGTSYEHPTEKPAALHEKALRRCTKPGQIVLDCFAGSGSLMIACEQLKRAAYMVEREPIFVDLIIRRYEALTGRKAVKV